MPGQCWCRNLQPPHTVCMSEAAVCGALNLHNNLHNKGFRNTCNAVEAGWARMQGGLSNSAESLNHTQDVTSRQNGHSLLLRLRRDAAVRPRQCWKRLTNDANES